MEKGMGGRRWGKRSWKASFIYVWINCQQYRKLSRETKKRRRRETGFWRARGAGRKARRTKERAEKGKHYSSMPSKHQMLGYFNKKPPFIWERRRWSKRERVGEDASVWQQAETPSQKLGNGKWKHGASDKQLLLLNRTKRFFLITHPCISFSVSLCTISCSKHGVWPHESDESFVT